ncbi:hypothetical protein, partial [Microbulbifer agarilyticus]|uniref:hypothetical protein n=1 Tax=Microbulbifer agarilyticus TaxID=260552 RepID=UPI001CD5C332
LHIMIICPKCEYKRNGYERVPDWQCPACGVAYSKIAAIEEEAIAQREQWKREDEEIEERVDELRPFAVACISLYFIYFSYFFITGQSCFGVVWPIILGVSLLLLCQKMIATGIFFHQYFTLTPRERYPTNFKVELLAGLSAGVWLVYVGMSNYWGAA